MSFFYNNAQECSNFKFKSKIREKKIETSTGYRVNTKCTWVEAIEVYKELVESTRRGMQRSILRKRNTVEWAKMSDSERRKHVDRLNLSLTITTPDKIPNTTVINLTESEDDDDRVMASKLPASGLPGSSCTSSSNKPSTSREDRDHTISQFNDSGLPEFLRGSWENAKKIIDLGGIGSHPTSVKRCVLSLSQPITHSVHFTRFEIHVRRQLSQVQRMRYLCAHYCCGP